MPLQINFQEFQIFLLQLHGSDKSEYEQLQQISILAQNPDLYSEFIVQTIEKQDDLSNSACDCLLLSLEQQQKCFMYQCAGGYDQATKYIERIFVLYEHTEQQVLFDIVKQHIEICAYHNYYCGFRLQFIKQAALLQTNDQNYIKMNKMALKLINILISGNMSTKTLEGFDYFTYVFNCFKNQRLFSVSFECISHFASIGNPHLNNDQTMQIRYYCLQQLMQQQINCIDNGIISSLQSLYNIMPNLHIDELRILLAFILKLIHNSSQDSIIIESICVLQHLAKSIYKDQMFECLIHFDMNLFGLVLSGEMNVEQTDNDNLASDQKQCCIGLIRTQIYFFRMEFYKQLVELSKQKLNSYITLFIMYSSLEVTMNYLSVEQTKEMMQFAVNQYNQQNYCIKYLSLEIIQEMFLYQRQNQIESSIACIVVKHIISIFDSVCLPLKIVCIDCLTNVLSCYVEILNNYRNEICNIVQSSYQLDSAKIKTASLSLLSLIFETQSFSQICSLIETTMPIIQEQFFDLARVILENANVQISDTELNAKLIVCLSIVMCSYPHLFEENCHLVINCFVFILKNAVYFQNENLTNSCFEAFCRVCKQYSFEKHITFLCSIIETVVTGDVGFQFREIILKKQKLDSDRMQYELHCKQETLQFLSELLTYQQQSLCSSINEVWKVIISIQIYQKDSLFCQLKSIILLANVARHIDTTAIKSTAQQQLKYMNSKTDQKNPYNHFSLEHLQYIPQLLTQLFLIYKNCFNECDNDEFQRNTNSLIEVMKYYQQQSFNSLCMKQNPNEEYRDSATAQQNAYLLLMQYCTFWHDCAIFYSIIDKADEIRALISNSFANLTQQLLQIRTCFRSLLVEDDQKLPKLQYSCDVYTMCGILEYCKPDEMQKLFTEQWLKIFSQLSANADDDNLMLFAIQFIFIYLIRQQYKTEIILNQSEQLVSILKQYVEKANPINQLAILLCKIVIHIIQNQSINSANIEITNIEQLQLLSRLFMKFDAVSMIKFCISVLFGQHYTYYIQRIDKQLHDMLLKFVEYHMDSLTVDDGIKRNIEYWLKYVLK